MDRLHIVLSHEHNDCREGGRVDPDGDMQEGGPRETGLTCV